MPPTVVPEAMAKSSVCAVLVDPTATEPKFKLALDVPGTGTVTAMLPEVPVMLVVVVSVAVIVWLPEVLSVAEKVPTPLVSVLSAGSTALASVLVK